MTELEALKEQVVRMHRAITMLNRRASNHIVGAVPPIPIFMFVEKPDENGRIMRLILPADGKITRVCLGIESYELDEFVNFTVRLQSVDNTQDKSFASKRTTLVQALDLDVKAGQMFSLSVDKPLAIAGVAISFLYQTVLGDSVKIMIDYDSLGIGDEGIRELIR